MGTPRMIWALLAILGVPIWLIVGALVGAVVSRRRFRSQPEVFPLLFRAHDTDGWPRSLSYGRYIRDVLLVNHGIALIRTSIHTVVQADPLDIDEDPKQLVDPIAWTLSLDDGEVVDIAVSAADVQHVAGSSSALSPRSVVRDPGDTS
jgi:hypothetical protein